MKILLYSDPGIIGTLIRWQTRSPVNHAAILIGDDVYEATMPRVRVRRFGRRDELAEVYAIEDLCFGPGTHGEASVRRFLLKQLGKPYDFSSVARFVTRKQERRESAGHWFCSELVYAALAKAGLRVLERSEPWEVSPGMLRRSPLLRREA
jgi:uncharacterized protein YycO